MKPVNYVFRRLYLIFRIDFHTFQKMSARVILYGTP